MGRVVRAGSATCLRVEAWRWEGPEIFQELQKNHCTGAGLTPGVQGPGRCLQGSRLCKQF